VPRKTIIIIITIVDINNSNYVWHMGLIFHIGDFNVMNFCAVPTSYMERMLNGCKCYLSHLLFGQKSGMGDVHQKFCTNLIFVRIGHTRSELRGGASPPRSQYASLK
jgi:hypothetical protein